MEIKSQILAQMIVKDSDTYVVGASARNFTPIDILIRVVVALLAIAILVAVIYLVFKVILPRIMRYLGYLSWEFKKESNK
ncbi:hypothetical protein A3F62_02180 [Candidatus Woesebacteria bacterium RIFCSPHIGHO2_12_FULL_44_11]|uniref:Uncharacterized protein n=1 Tax=Candidatus Woesebacteria bacterium RIFCSPLOWO2_01_FULL_44_14 TaxID=1802525 RepID=A0A1F8C4P6_9BACT|nr:MAG: hypothetical protein A3F62_02180 [Candidatus Woesebacteria bacterium RIFCSPHIGHO2_12_FULL_44_11]OGM70869.1 MAG: hypothetical protein A2975_01170 [Candidatus Woesebacteria bacterium RIFCSPLOWO2_01_FULL_44_14]